MKLDYSVDFFLTLIFAIESEQTRNNLYKKYDTRSKNKDCTFDSQY